MLLDFDTTKKTVNLILGDPSKFPNFVPSEKAGAFFESVDKHLNGLGLSGDQWEKLASVYPKRTLENSALVQKLTPSQKEKLQVAQIEASDEQEFVSIYFKPGFELPNDQFIELEKLLGVDLGDGGYYLNVYTQDGALIEKAKEFIGPENIDEIPSGNEINPALSAKPKGGKYYIYDWAGNQIDCGPFEDFEDAWGWIREKHPDEEDWQEYDVQKKAEGGADAEAGSKENERVNKWLQSMENFGAAPDQAWADGNLLYSYNTVIAKRLGKKLFVNTTKYSNTTTKLIRHLEAVAQSAGLQVVPKEEKFFGTQMEQKLPFAASINGDWHTTAEDIALFCVNDIDLYNALEACRTYNDFTRLAEQAIQVYNGVTKNFEERQFKGDINEVATALMEVKSAPETEEEDEIEASSEGKVPGKVVVRHGCYMVRHEGEGGLKGKFFHLGHDEAENEKLGKDLFGKEVKFHINENDDAVDVTSAIVEAASADPQVLKTLESNKGAPEEMVKKAAESAGQGWWLERLKGIAEAVGNPLAAEFQKLMDEQDKAGYKPPGLQEKGDKFGRELFISLVDGGWTREQLKEIAWGVPWDALKEFDMVDLRSDGDSTQKSNGSTVQASAFQFTDQPSQEAALKEFFEWMLEGRIENDANDPEFQPEMLGQDVEDQLTGVSGEVNGQPTNDIFKTLTNGIAPEKIGQIAESVPGIDYIKDGWAYYDTADYVNKVTEKLNAKSSVQASGPETHIEVLKPTLDGIKVYEDEADENSVTDEWNVMDDILAVMERRNLKSVTVGDLMEQTGLGVSYFMDTLPKLQELGYVKISDSGVQSAAQVNQWGQMALDNDFNGLVAEWVAKLPDLFQVIMNSPMADRFQGGINDIEELKTSDGKTVYFIEEPGHGWYFDPQGEILGEEDGGFDAPGWEPYNAERQQMHDNAKTVVGSAGDDIQKAKDLGRAAFEAGKKAVPVQDKALMDMVKQNSGKPVGTSIPILKAWSEGWHEANAQKSVEGSLVTAMSIDECVSIIEKVAQKAIDEGLIDDMDSAKFDAAEALYLWLQHNHGGQNSAEYELLSSMLQEGCFKPRHGLNDVEDLEEAGQFLYNDMESILPPILDAASSEEPPEPAPAASTESAEKSKLFDMSLKEVKEALEKGEVNESEITRELGPGILSLIKEKMAKPDKKAEASEAPTTEVERALQRMDNLKHKAEQAREAGDLRKADRYDAMVERLIEENAEDDDFMGNISA